MARSHGTRAPTPRANRVSRVRVARSRARLGPMVLFKLYTAHVGVDPPGVTAAGLGCTVARSHVTRAGTSESRAERRGLVCGPDRGAPTQARKGPGRPG